MLESKDIYHLRNQQFEDALVYFSKSILGKNNEDDILWDLAKNCISKLGFVDCVVYVLNQNQKILIQKAAHGVKSRKDYHLYNPVKIELGKGVSGTVALTGKAEIINDTSKDARYNVDDEIRLSELTVPIIIDGTVYGVIDCEHPDKNFFTSQHLKIVLAFASICAIKIENVRAEKLLKDKQDTLLKINQEMVELKLKALHTQLNPHFVFNTLNAVQNFITTENKKLALEYLSTFSKLIRFYLVQIEKETVSLKDEITVLNRYIKLQKLRYDNQFDCKIIVDESTQEVDAIIPSFILQTLFENIIEHAIFNQHKNYFIKARFNVSKKHVKVNISYSHNISSNAEDIYSPEYRKQLMQWQDQISLLNTIKKYGIEKQIRFNKGSKQIGGNIFLRLPNLI